MNYLYVSDNKLAKRENEVSLGVADDGKYLYISRDPIANTDPDNTLALAGNWDNEGTLITVDHTLYQQYFASFKNDADGMATGNQDVHGYQGHSQRKMQDATPAHILPEYPVDKQPFIVKMSRYRSTSAWPGWYWLFEIEFADHNRPPGVRTVAIYDENWVYQYTVGALVHEDFPGPPDEEGNPTTIQKWVGRCPAGRQSTVPEVIHYGLLYASQIEGKMILEAEDMEQIKYFWEHTG